jgi:anti-sigma-K factor RskA/putative zinc finger protein
MTHDELKALLPLAALERLEPEEVAALREHLAGCAECDAELREFEHAMAMFALALEAPAKEDRVMQKLEARLAAPTPTASAVPTTSVAVAPTPVAAAPKPTPALKPAPPPAREPARVVEPLPARRDATPRWAPRLAIAASVVLALYGAAVTSRLRDLKYAYDERGDRLTYLQTRFTTLEHQAQDASQKMDALSKVLNERIQLEQVLDAPDLEVTRLAPIGPTAGAHAVIVMSKASGNTVLRVNGLDAPPPGKIYELWWITKQQGPVEAATFTAESGKEVLTKVGPPPAGDRLMATAVTLEPAAGVPKPTGVMYLKGSPERE